MIVLLLIFAALVVCCVLFGLELRHAPAHDNDQEREELVEGLLQIAEQLRDLESSPLLAPGTPARLLEGYARRTVEDLANAIELDELANWMEGR